MGPRVPMWSSSPEGGNLEGGRVRSPAAMADQVEPQNSGRVKCYPLTSSEPSLYPRDPNTVSWRQLAAAAVCPLHFYSQGPGGPWVSLYLVNLRLKLLHCRGGWPPGGREDMGMGGWGGPRARPFQQKSPWGPRPVTDVQPCSSSPRGTGLRF